MQVQQAQAPHCLPMLPRSGSIRPEGCAGPVGLNRAPFPSRLELRARRSNSHAPRGVELLDASHVDRDAAGACCVLRSHINEPGKAIRIRGRP